MRRLAKEIGIVERSQHREPHARVQSGQSFHVRLPNLVERERQSRGRLLLAIGSDGILTQLEVLERAVGVGEGRAEHADAFECVAGGGVEGRAAQARAAEIELAQAVTRRTDHGTEHAHRVDAVVAEGGDAQVGL